MTQTMALDLDLRTGFLPQLARINSIQALTEQEKLFAIELPGKHALGHQPGQFVEVSCLGVGEAPISICSAPSRSNSHFELCIRKAGELTGAIHALQAGDRIGIRGPFGRGFPLHQFRGKDLLFILGGLGLAPARSVIQQVLAERGAGDELLA